MVRSRPVPFPPEPPRSAVIQLPRSPLPRSPLPRSPLPRSPLPRSPLPRSPLPRSPLPRSPLARADARDGRRDVRLRLPDRLGLGFDSEGSLGPEPSSEALVWTPGLRPRLAGNP
jgi:hypothetical protein